MIKNSVIDLQKPDGTVINDLRCSVQDERLLIEAAPGKWALETDDIVIWKRSDGLTSTYRVVRATYHEGLTLIKARYDAVLTPI